MRGLITALLVTFVFASVGCLDESTFSDAAGGCDPNYEGACLDPNASEYNCASGSGDGPGYTGRVSVVGSDSLGLDAAGDGVGCE